MKKITLSLLLLLISMTGFCTTWTITAATNPLVFNPDTITITLGDSVNFVIASVHNAIEVNQSTWDANGNTSDGGFSVPFGGGLVLPAQLTVGTHWYVCSPHAASGMKGVIIVQNNTGIVENQLQTNFSVYPNPSSDLITIKVNAELLGSIYRITNPLGITVLTGKLTTVNTIININELTVGLYLLQVGEQKKQTFKILKK